MLPISKLPIETSISPKMVKDNSNGEPSFFNVNFLMRLVTSTPSIKIRVCTALSATSTVLISNFKLSPHVCSVLPAPGTMAENDFKETLSVEIDTI